jgi:hypothetical protein
MLQGTRVTNANSLAAFRFRQGPDGSFKNVHQPASDSLVFLKSGIRGEPRRLLEYRLNPKLEFNEEASSGLTVRRLGRFRLRTFRASSERDEAVTGEIF